MKGTDLRSSVFRGLVLATRSTSSCAPTAIFSKTGAFSWSYPKKGRAPFCEPHNCGPFSAPCPHQSRRDSQACQSPLTVLESDPSCAKDMSQCHL